MTKYQNMSVEELMKHKKELEAILAKNRKEVDVLMECILKNVQTLKSVDDALDSHLLDGNDIESLLETFPETKTKRRLTDEYFKKWEWGLRPNGYFPDTEQRCIQISLYKHDDEHTKMVHDGILELLPYIKPLKDGKKRFDIFEHTLSYYYSFYLVQTEDGEFQVVTHIDVGPPRKRSHDLMVVLKYIQEHLYYEKGKAP